MVRWFGGDFPFTLDKDQGFKSPNHSKSLTRDSPNARGPNQNGVDGCGFLADGRRTRPAHPGLHHRPQHAPPKGHVHLLGVLEVLILRSRRASGCRGPSRGMAWHSSGGADRFFGGRLGHQARFKRTGESPFQEFELRFRPELLDFHSSCAVITRRWSVGPRRDSSNGHRPKSTRCCWASQEAPRFYQHMALIRP